jgi:phosphoribosyl 1,2-cyclic phosphodiesterase
MALSSLERHLAQIRPKRLILTHMSDDMLARRAEVPFETAEDGMIVEL